MIAFCGTVRLLGCLGLILIVLFIFTPAMTQAKERGIAVIKSRDIPQYNQALSGFIASCSDGITEYDLRGKKKRGKRIIKQILKEKPRLILAIGPLAAQIAKERLSDFPVIFFMVSTPQKYSLEGKNIAGISLDISSETQLTTYKSLVPTLKTIGVIYDPKKTSEIVKQIRVIAERLGIQLLASPATSKKAVPKALRSILGKIDMLWMLPDSTVITPESFKFFLVSAFENNLPFIAVSDIFVEVGALASLSPDYTDVGRQGCQLATEIASGQLSLNTVDVLPPTKVNLTINLKTAQKIGLAIPAAIIKSASKVYQ